MASFRHIINTKIDFFYFINYNITLPLRPPVPRYSPRYYSQRYSPAYNPLLQPVYSPHGLAHSGFQ